MPTIASLKADDYEIPEEVRARLLSPTLIVHLDRARKNARKVIQVIGGPERWRPHVKTTKLPQVWAALLKLGVRHFKCATTLEARLLLQSVDAQGLSDVDLLVAYPHLPPALDEIGRLASAHKATRVSVLCEDPDVLRHIPQLVSIFIDVNSGMDRTGLEPAEVDAILQTARAAGTRFRGLHFYEGHLIDTDAEVRREKCFLAYERLVALRRRLEEEDLTVRELVTSGTPTFRMALEFPGFKELEDCVHRVSPGTVVFHDTRSEPLNPDLDLTPAAVVFSRVVSHPTPGIVTCDAGSKSLGADAGDPVAVVLGRPELLAMTPSEEHLPLHVEAAEAPARGTELLLVPRHVCTTVNLARQAVLLDGGEFKEVVPVTARGHDALL
jgi:D-serine deaminase-like pyridoxal phosphate-dependent protein